MAVVSEDLGDVSFAHGDHRDAIGEAMTFVSARFVEGKTAQKRFPRLGDNQDARMAHGFFEHIGNDAALSFASRREIVEKLNENFIGRYERRFYVSLAKVGRRLMPCISRICNGNPIEAVHKDFCHSGPQSLRRLGAP